MCNPDKLCFGSGGFTAERPRKLTYRKYFNQDVDSRFVAQYIVEAKQILDDANNFIWRQNPCRQYGGQPVTASQVKKTKPL